MVQPIIRSSIPYTHARVASHGAFTSTVGTERRQRDVRKPVCCLTDVLHQPSGNAAVCRAGQPRRHPATTRRAGARPNSAGWGLVERTPGPSSERAAVMSLAKPRSTADDHAGPRLSPGRRRASLATFMLRDHPGFAPQSMNPIARACVSQLASTPAPPLRDRALRRPWASRVGAFQPRRAVRQRHRSAGHLSASRTPGFARLPAARQCRARC